MWGYKEHFIFALAFASFTTFILGIFVYLRGKGKKIKLIFALYSFSISWWSGTQIGNIYGPTLEASGHWARVEQMGVVFIPTLFLHFVFTFLGMTRKLLLRFCYIFSFVFALLSPTTKLISPGAERKFGVINFGNPGPLYGMLVAFFVICVVYGIYLLVRAYLNSTGSRRNQLKYLWLSYVVGYLGGAPNFFIVWNVNIPIVNPYGAYLAPIYAVIIAYAISRYSLLDVNIAITRAGIFGMVYTLVLGIPFWLGFKFLGSGQWIIPVSVMAVFATIGPFTYQYLRRRAEKVILKEQHRYQQTLRRLSATMTLVKDLDRLSKLIVYRVARAVKVEFACIYLADKNKGCFLRKSPYAAASAYPDFPAEIPFDGKIIAFLENKHQPVFAEELSPDMHRDFNLKSGLIVPSFVKDRLLGFLTLGPKSQNRIYTRDDAEIFEVLANQAALAIENTEFIQESQKTQAQLFAAERMASMGTMAGGLSHQINNRFHAIAMAASDTADTLSLLDAEQAGKEEIKAVLSQIKHALGRINENTKHGGAIVNNFLNFSQPDRLNRGVGQFDIREPLERAVEMVKLKSSITDEYMKREISESLPQIQGDLVLLQEVFFNLIDNSFDAIKERERLIKDGSLRNPEQYKGLITVAIRKIDSTISIQIQDNGIGIKEENQKKLFSPFFTTKATSSKGTGLGLFVIQKIIAAHNGQIKLHSEYGQGTLIAITLPISVKKEK